MVNARRTFSAGLLAVLVSFAAIGSTWAQPTGSAPASQVAARSDVNPSADALLNKGLDQAMEGQFAPALETLQAAAAVDPTNKLVAEAIGQIEAYLAVRKETQAQRQQELDYEVKRIGWAYLAQEYVETLDKKDFAEEFRKLIKDDLDEAYNEIGTASGFEDASAEQAETMKATSIEKIAQAEKALARAVALLEGETTEYAREFRAQAQALQQRLDQARAVWQKVDPASVQSRWQGARDIRTVQDDLADAVTDLEVMVAKKPWKVALLHGQLAREIALDPDSLKSRLWYIEMIKDAEKQGRLAIDEARWYDALTAWSALKEFEPAEKRYKQALDTVRRHVRVLRLYGQEDPDEEGDEEVAVEEEETDEEESDEPAWKEIVAGVDAQMVRQAISKLGRSYVESVDFAKLTRGGLESLKVLVNTPQVAETFPGLADETKKQAFLDALDQELADIDSKDQIDHVRLQMALNKVIYSSEDSVQIPLEVIVVEFADGVLSELDKFSTMIWPSDVTNFNKSTMGHFTGIGVQITKEPGKPLKVTTPLLDTPAYRAGIKAGDLIMEVDGVPTEKKTVDALIKRIMGPPDSTVMLTIKRRGVPELMKVPVVRQPVHIRTVKGWQRKDGGVWTYQLRDGHDIGYVRITQFTDNTHEELLEALAELKEAGATSLVLDLRANPGGLLRSAAAVADEFLPRGRRIVFTRGRQVPRNEIDATKDGEYLQGDMVVLVDQHSASAAEILSGAMKDWSRATIVGKRSYGKGSVQNVIPVRMVGDKAFLKLTTAYYYLPSGRLLHRTDDAKDWGVNPDIEVMLTPKQMRRWLEIRRKTDLLKKVDPELLEADLKSQYQADLQLATAVLLLELKQIKQQAQSDQAYAVEKKSDGAM